MDFKEFAQILKPIIGGSYNTSVFARTLFESILTEEGINHIDGTSENTYKAYYNGKTKITRIAKKVLPYIDSYEFISYLDNYGDATAQRLYDAFLPYIDDINLQNASEKISILFEGILLEAAETQRKSTPKSAKKKKIKINLVY